MNDHDRTRDEGLDRRITTWLEDGPELAPFDFVESTLAPIPAMAQRRRSPVAIGRLTISVGTLARLAVAAVVVVALVGLGSVILHAGLLGVGGPQSSPPASASPSTQRPLPSGVSFTNAGPLGASQGSDPGKAGTYQTLQFKPAFRFTVPAGWSTGQILNTFLGADESASGIALTNGGGVIVVTSPSSIYPPAPGDTGSPVPADLLATLAKDPKLTLGPTSAVTIGGLAGMQVEGIVKSDVQTGQDSGYRISDYLLAKPGNHVRLAVIVVGGQTVVVMTSATPADWAAFATTADAIIGSIALVP